MTGSMLEAIVVGIGTIIFVIWLSNVQVQEIHLISGGPYLASYHNYIEQLEWITEYNNRTDVLSKGSPIRIYYDRRIIYHVTTPDGCRFKCEYPTSTELLKKGDLAVFSTDFDVEMAAQLKARGVFIGFETGESAIFNPHPKSESLALVDLFINYRTASPVPWMYGCFVRYSNPLYSFTSKEKAAMKTLNSTHLLPPFHKNRSRLIAWVVSNDHPANNRQDFAEAISSFVQVDVYGGAGKSLPKNAEAFPWLSRQYKFYLAFENSNCRDYITEKVYMNALSNGLVPIVLGAYKEDYEGALPPNSYINVDDYSSIEELADYVRYLDGNDTAYASYFAWKEVGRVVTINRPDCRLCGYLNRLRAGSVKMTKPDPRAFVDPNYLCFNRPLLPRKKRPSAKANP